MKRNMYLQGSEHLLFLCERAFPIVQTYRGGWSGRDLPVRFSTSLYRCSTISCGKIANGSSTSENIQKYWRGRSAMA